MISINTGLLDINQLQFSPDGTCLVATQPGGGTHLLNAQTFESIARYPHSGQIAFSSDTQILAIASFYNITIHRRGQVPLLLEKSDGSWDDIRFSANDRHLEASSYRTGGFARWDAMTGHLLHDSCAKWGIKCGGLAESRARIEGLTYSLSNGHRVSLTSYNSLHVNKVFEAIVSNASGELGRIRLDNKGMMPCRPLISADGRRMVVRYVLLVGIWNLETLSPIACISFGSKPFVGAALTPDGRQLMAIVNTDRCVRFWSLEDGAPGETFDWNIGYPTAIAVAPDGLRFAVANAKGQVVVWDAA